MKGQILTLFKRNIQSLRLPLFSSFPFFLLLSFSLNTGTGWTQDIFTELHSQSFLLLFVCFEAGSYCVAKSWAYPELKLSVLPSQLPTVLGVQSSTTTSGCLKNLYGYRICKQLEVTPIPESAVLLLLSCGWQLWARKAEPCTLMVLPRNFLPTNATGRSPVSSSIRGTWEDLPSEDHWRYPQLWARCICFFLRWLH